MLTGSPDSAAKRTCDWDGLGTADDAKPELQIQMSETHLPGRHLVSSKAVEIGNARVHVHHGVHRTEHVLARMLFIIDEGLRQLTLIPVGTVYDDVRLSFTRFSR